MRGMKSVLVAVLVCSFLLSAAGAFADPWTKVFSFDRGNDPKSLAWETLPGKPQEVTAGPAAFCIPVEGSALIADSLNLRILFAQASGTPRSPIDLVPVASQAGFAVPVSAGDIGLSGDGSLYVADHSNRTVHIFDKEGKYSRSLLNAYGMGRAFLQIDRLQVDDKGRSFIEDLAGLKTVIFGPDGIVSTVLPGFTTLAIDRNGTIYRVLFEGQSRERKIEICDPSGKPLRTLGKVSGKVGILFIYPIGVSPEGNLFLFIACPGGNEIVGMDKDGKEFLREKAPQPPSWPGCGFPYRVGGDGNLYVLDVGNPLTGIRKIWRNR